MKKYIGFDIDDKKTVACVYTPETEEFRFSKFHTDLWSMQDFLAKERKKGDEIHLTFEVSGRAGYLYDGLVDKVDTLTVSNPAKMTWIYRTKKKNDRMDAKKQAILLAVNQIPKVHMPAREVREWRALIGHRQKMVEGRTQCKNRIRAHFKNQGIVNPYRRGWWSQRSLKWMREAASGGQTPWHLTLENLLEELEMHERQIQSVTERLDAIGEKDWRIRLLQTIPGVGPRTAEAVVAYTDEVERFQNSKQYAAYFGLTPKLDESGDCRRLGHISKQGPGVVRWLLVEGCWRAVRRSPSLQAFYRRVMHGQKNRKKIAVVAVARKLTTIIYAMLKTGEEFNEDLVAVQFAQAA
jgi:transposase